MITVDSPGSHTDLSRFITDDHHDAQPLRIQLFLMNNYSNPGQFRPSQTVGLPYDKPVTRREGVKDVTIIHRISCAYCSWHTTCCIQEQKQEHPYYVGGEQEQEQQHGFIAQNLHNNKSVSARQVI